MAIEVPSQALTGGCPPSPAAPQMPERRAHTRNKTFDLLRILFAILVLLAHAPELTDGNESRELLSRFAHVPLSFGGLAVDGFFLLSGYLIVQSWQGNARLRPFLEKRLLRILPGYLVAVIISIVLCGLLAPAVPHFFAEYAQHAAHNLKSITHLENPLAPDVFPGGTFHIVNGSLWTIAYEFRCYLLVALLGVAGAIRRPVAWVACTAGLVAAWLIVPLQAKLTWHTYWIYLGEPARTYRLMSVFFIGGCFFLLRRHIRFRPGYALIAALPLLLSSQLYPALVEPVLALCGGYLLFYLGQHRFALPDAVQRFPDISYGLYLYGWPIEGLWIHFVHGSPWVTFAGSAVLAGALGSLSWHLVEKPMLRFKPRLPALPQALSSASSPSSSSTLTPSEAALSSLDPASSPATT